LEILSEPTAYLLHIPYAKTPPWAKRFLSSSQMESGLQGHEVPKGEPRPLAVRRAASWTLLAADDPEEVA